METDFEARIRPFKFNDEQLDVLSRVNDYIQMSLTLPTTKKLIITGSAGTGKTSIIIHSIIASWLNEKIPILDVDYILCAPTNKAKDVMITKFGLYTAKLSRDTTLMANYPELRNKLKKNIQFKTISQVLNIKIQINDAGYQEFTKGSSEKVISKYSEPSYENTVFIIDESSMIDTHYAGILLELPRPVIFLGDRCQLPPVKELSSIIFTLQDSENYEIMNLTQVERATGDIVTASNFLRELMNKPLPDDQPQCLISFIKTQITDLNPANIKLYESKPKSWFAEYINRIMSSVASGDMGLTWTNKRCEILNNKVRTLLAEASGVATTGDNTLPLLMVREKILIKDAYYSHGNKLYSSMLVSIKSTTPLTCPNKYKPLTLLEWLNCIYYGQSFADLPSHQFKPEYKPLNIMLDKVPVTTSVTGKKKPRSSKTLKDFWSPTIVASNQTLILPATPGQDLANLRPAWPATNNYYKTCQFASDCGIIPLEYIDSSSSSSILLSRFIDSLDLSPDEIGKIYSKGMRLDLYRDYHMFASQYLFDIPIDKLCCPLCQFLSNKLYSLVLARDTHVYKMIELTRDITLDSLQCVLTCGKRMNILSQTGREQFQELEKQVESLLNDASQRKIQLNRAELVAFRQLLNDEGSSLLSAGVYGSTSGCSISLSYILGHYWNHCFKDVYATWDYGYFITVHKSQGSDYDNVFLDYHDLINNTKASERDRLIYTGLTRTRNTCHIYYNP